jgi:hypothetical protein
MKGLMEHGHRGTMNRLVRTHVSVLPRLIRRGDAACSLFMWRMSMCNACRQQAHLPTVGAHHHGLPSHVHDLLSNSFRGAAGGGVVDDHLAAGGAKAEGNSFANATRRASNHANAGVNCKRRCAWCVNVEFLLWWWRGKGRARRCQRA